MNSSGDRRRLLARLQELPARHGWLRWAVLGLGLAFSLGGAYLYDAELGRTAGYRFQVLALDKANEIDLRVRAYGDVLYALRGLFDASDKVTHDEFNRFANALSLGERYPGITNISFSFRVPGERKQEFERKIRAEMGRHAKDLPPFTIKPPGERPEYVVLTYIEPMGKNVAAWGLDLYADPQRRAVVERACETGRLSSSSGITLVRDSNSKITSTLLRLAVYRGGGVPASAEERRRLYSGIVGSTLRVDEMIDAALSKQTLSQMRLRIFSGGEGAQGEEAVLYDSRATATASKDYSAYAVGYRVAVGDRDWRLEFTPLVDPVEAFDRTGPAGLLAVGIAVSALLFWLMTSLATNLRLRDELVEQATHDTLTALYNRRYMQEWFYHELHRAQRHGRPIGVVMLDIDHFKRVNDGFGHEAGDLVLRELAALIRRLARKSDIVCRLGGEEFVLLMPESPLDGTLRKAEELRREVARLSLASRGRPLPAITVSIGVALFPQHAQDVDGLLRRADEALYAAKQAGRDRTAVAA
jgi:diguanylate cyclase (GGDEF)-like protein